MITLTYIEVNVMPCKVRPSEHTIKRMVERGISRTEVSETVNKGAKRVSGKKIISRYGKLEAVYVQRPCNQFVITVYWK